MTDNFDLAAEAQSERLDMLAGNALREWGMKNRVPQLIKCRENPVHEIRTAYGEHQAQSNSCGFEPMSTMVVALFSNVHRASGAGASSQIGGSDSSIQISPQ